jgi:hypothetical protein
MRRTCQELMKIFAAILILAALMLAIVVNRNPEKTVYPISFEELKPGEINPPLRRLGDTWPLPEGTKVWFKTNQHPFGVVDFCDSEKAHFKDPPGLTFMRAAMRHDFFEAK